MRGEGIASLLCVLVALGLVYVRPQLDLPITVGACALMVTLALINTLTQPARRALDGVFGVLVGGVFLAVVLVPQRWPQVRSVVYVGALVLVAILVIGRSAVRHRTAQ